MGREITELTSTASKTQLSINQWIMAGTQTVKLNLEEIGELVGKGNHHRHTQKNKEKSLERMMLITQPTQPCIQGNSPPLLVTKSQNPSHRGVPKPLRKRIISWSRLFRVSIKLFITAYFSVIESDSLLNKTLSRGFEFFFVLLVEFLQPFYLIVSKVEDKAREFCVNDKK